MIKKVGLLTVLTSLIIVSCKDDKLSSIKKKDVQVDNVVENVINEDKVLNSFSSRKYGDDLVEEIYQEILNKDRDLTKLDNKIKDLNKRTDAVIGEYNSVLSKSSEFYKIALSKTKTFKDSLLAQKIDSLIATSSNLYAGKTFSINTAIDNARSNQDKINELYTAYKIKRTLIEIEKFQNTNTFDLTNINNSVSEQLKLIEEIEKVSSK